MVKTLPFNSGSVSSILGQGAKIPHGSWPKNQNIKQKQYCNKLNKDFKKWSTLKKKTLKKTIEDIISLLFIKHAPLVHNLKIKLVKLITWASLVAQTVKNLPAMQETPVQYLGWEDPLEKGME